MNPIKTIIQDLKDSGPFIKTMILIFLLGFCAIIYRYVFGIGAITNLSNAYPWGLWISFDVLCGVALAAGGFTTAGIVHVFGGKKYEPLARPAVLTAFLGYLLVVGAILVDVGRPWNLWHPLVMWQYHSVMFEVGWCVTLYTFVLAVEFSPSVFEKLGMDRALKTVTRVFIPFVIAGMILSCLHQSSLGSLFLIVPYKLDHIWWTPILPLLFLLSAIAVGIAMVIFETLVASNVFKHKLEMNLLSKFGRALPFILIVYLVMKVADLVARNQVLRIFEFNIMAICFWMEIVIGILIPTVILIQREAHHDKRYLLGASICVIAGVVLNRLDVSIIGMHVRGGHTYFPHPLEFLVTACIVSVGIIAYYLIVKNLPITHHETPVEGGYYE